jgi:hypothetical protein
MKPASKTVPAVMRLPVLAELISRGDGTYILKPRVPDPELHTWITIRQAAELMSVQRQAVYGLLNRGLLVYRRPLRRKILVSLESARALREATLDPDFWENPVLQQRTRIVVRAAMKRLVRKGGA